MTAALNKRSLRKKSKKHDPEEESILLGQEIFSQKTLLKLNARKIETQKQALDEMNNRYLKEKKEKLKFTQELKSIRIEFDSLTRTFNHLKEDFQIETASRTADLQQEIGSLERKIIRLKERKTKLEQEHEDQLILSTNMRNESASRERRLVRLKARSRRLYIRITNRKTRLDNLQKQELVLEKKVSDQIALLEQLASDVKIEKNFTKEVIEREMQIRRAARDSAAKEQKKLAEIQDDVKSHSKKEVSYRTTSLITNKK